MNKFVIMGIVTALLICGAGGAYYYFEIMSADQEEKKPPVDDRAFIYVEVPPVVANFSVKGKMRYLQITLSIQTRDTASSELLKDNLPLIQSELLLIMQASDFDDLNTRDGKKRFLTLVENDISALFDQSPKPFELERAMLTGFVIQ